jgi:hypothetical protein
VRDLKGLIMKILPVALIIWSLGVTSALCQTDSPLVLERRIVLTGVKGKFDHFALDERRGRLFAAVTGNKSVEVVDLASGKTIESLTGMGKPHGVAWVEKVGQRGRLFVADGEKASLQVFEGEPLKLVKSIPLSEDADDMAYDSESGLLYVGHGGSNATNPASIAIVDTTRLTIEKQLPAAAHPEALELDPALRRVFVNISDTGEVLVIDSAAPDRPKTWKLTNTKGNTPLAYDTQDGLLLVGCRTPAKLLALSAANGMEMGSSVADSGADDLFFEPKTHRAYLIAGSGAIDTYAVSPDGKLRPMAVTHTAVGAKTGLLVPSKGLLYIGIPGVDVASEIDVYRTGTK